MSDLSRKLDEALGLAAPAAPATKPATTPKPSTKPDPLRPKQPHPDAMPKPKALPAAPLAPAKPQTKPTTTPSTRPVPRDPMRPKQPHPSVQPKPKACPCEDASAKLFSLAMNEAYEDEAHPNTQKFWQDQGDHPFRDHPILSRHGHNLSKSAFDYTTQRADKVGGKLSMQNMMTLVQQAMALERQHADALLELAKDITVQIWNVDRETLHPKLSMDGGSPGGGGGEAEPEAPLNPDEHKHVQKRISMNTLTQGSAVHAMFTMHHLIDKKLAQISPRLLDIYNKIASASVYHYWLMDIPMILGQLAHMKAGEEEVKFDESGTPHIMARAVCFPVLCQELSKGVMEVLTMHHISELPPETGKKVIQHADKLEYEPWQIQVGPELWRRFLKAIPKKADIKVIVAALSVQEPDEVHKILELVIENPADAQQMLADLTAEPETFDVTEWNPIEGDDEGMAV